MKRLITFGLSLGLVAAMAVPALAGGPADKATGSGTWINHQDTEQMVVFNAHEEKGRRPAKGYLYQEARGGVGRNGTFEVANVTDVTVWDGYACFGGEITAATGDFYDDGDVGKMRWTVVKDGGSGIDETGMDLLRGGVSASKPAWCSTPAFGGNEEWWGGNVQIHLGKSDA